MLTGRTDRTSGSVKKSQGDKMAYRKKMNYGKSKKYFKKYSGSHKKNYRPMPMRGGYRL